LELIIETIRKGVDMKIVISPAKSLNFEKELPSAQFTEPSFLKESREIQKVLKQQSPGNLSELIYFG
jgi:cytoplasmic iron level regulating protein YaaA (DUF328/UPF0246 family)